MKQLFPLQNLLLIIVSCLLISCEENLIKADLIVTNGSIWTGNEKQPMVKAMAILGDSIIAIGTNEEIQVFKGNQTEVIDVRGKFITPGFIDAHVHLLMGGNSLLNVALRDAGTPKEFTSRIAKFTEQVAPGTWIVEGNWDHTLWGGELPTKEWIDEYTVDYPVAVYRLDGHMILANSAALKIAGIDKNTPEVPNGEIVRHPDGTPTGILKSNAMYLVLDKIPELSDTQKENAILAAQDYLLAHGVTSIHDVDSLGTYIIADKLLKTGKLNMRIYTADPISHWKELNRRTDTDSKWLKSGLLKGFVDGSLGSHTAAFKDAYSDRKNDHGFFINSAKDMYKWVSEADKKNWQITVHAIGDSAIHSLQNTFERVIQENGVKDRRFRMEHAQHIAPEDMNRFANLGIIVSVQPYHAIDDGRWAEDLIGPKRVKTTYAFKSLMDSKTTVVFGSDWPVAPASPLYGMYAAVTRRTLDSMNPEGWVPEQKISVDRALRAYTTNGAYASFDEHRKGSLEAGKLADFVILSENLTTIDPIHLKDTKVLATYVGGKKVYAVLLSKN
ncbi:amidohydrolase [Flavobacteriaceae bacterium KMM 6898]|nr:amidohydrolase [Flavobacteriaceae bacterium KMM 6898]